MKTTETFTLLGVLFLVFAGSYAAIETFAKNEDLQFVEERLDRKILMDQLHDLEERIYDYDKKYGEGCQQCSEDQKDTYFKTKQKIRDIEIELGIGKTKT